MGQRFTRVVGLGLCMQDELYLVEDHVPEASRIRYRERVVSTGGMVATALGTGSSTSSAARPS